MVEIYRVENKRGEGCYRCRSCSVLIAIQNLIPDHWDAKNRPEPSFDLGIERRAFKREICCFKNMVQVLKWFNKKELEILRRFGFEVKKVLVQKITAIGECQVLAIK